MTWSPLWCCTSIIRSIAFVRALSSLSMVPTRAWPQTSPSNLFSQPFSRAFSLVRYLGWVCQTHERKKGRPLVITIHIPQSTPIIQIHPLQNNIHGSKVHCGSVFEPVASGLPYYYTPPVCVPDVLDALTVWRLEDTTLILCLSCPSGGTPVIPGRYVSW